LSPLRWGIPRLGRWLEGLEVVGAVVNIVGGCVEIYKRIREEEGKPECEHPGLQLAHSGPGEHEDHTGCACRPRFACLICGLSVSQGAFFEEEEEDGDA
jgi:hypothetical protein